MIRRLSLRARLLAITLALLVTGLTVVSAVVVRQLETELTARIDAQLTQMATALGAMPPTLVDLLRQRAARNQAPALPAEFDLIQEVRLAFLTADGTVADTVAGTVETPPSEGTPRLPRLDTAAVAARAGRPFTVPGDGEEQWRAVAVPSRAAGSGHASVVAAVSLGAMNSTVQRVRVASLVAGGLLLAVLAVTGGFAIKAGLAPLRRVEETAAAIAGGDLSRRVPEPAGPGTEVGRLARSLNGMLAQIERGFAAREESEARMRRFVADVSHELRTPLFGIKGFSELYRMGGTDADAALARVESESARLAKLVDDLLLLATMDLATAAETTGNRAPDTPAAPTGDGALRDGAFEVVLDLTPMDLRTLAADARADLAALDPTRPITLTGPDGGPPASAPVLGDEDRLRQVVANLVGNAVAHTPPGTPVRIGVGTVGPDAALVIADSGPGLSPEQAERVFDRFYRPDGSRNRTTGGAGLGLAIVRSITTAHGGRVEIDSSPGEGAAFRLLLPREPQ